MKVDGILIAREIRVSLTPLFTLLPKRARISVLVLSEDEATRQYIGIKERVGTALGIKVSIVRVPPTITTNDLVLKITEKASQGDGIIVQLPLPVHVDTEKIRNAIPKEKDIDCLGTDAYAEFETGQGKILPPVVGAFGHILHTHDVSVVGKNVVVVGHGRLVGQPATVWFKQQGAEVIVCDENTKDISEYTQKADIIVLGAGHPGLLKSDMIKSGVVILDAGTSESGGKVIGDADPHCEEKAALITPVPGGIGPVAIAILYKNLYTLITDRI
ncbi:MAG: bifunctional 5,10-methylenetetrahydrofolate dehydrogenase/5,10-methenyltetrahydrofolate cyclohydrolase [Patescibacteria group bacterium]